jgi:hypothetical protein
MSENNFLEEVHKGWYLAVPPHAAKGHSTPWYSNYWDFCAQYLEDLLVRYGVLPQSSSFIEYRKLYSTDATHCTFYEGE